MKIASFRSQILNVPEDEPLAGALEKEGSVRPIVILTLGTDDGVEGIGVSQVFSFLAPYLRIVGVPDADRAPFVGLFSALIFIVGMPLVPLWGVWADKYSRKAVIVRSCIVEAVVFACVALSREPWQLAVSLLLIGFQLGNTGIMLGAIRATT